MDRRAHPRQAPHGRAAFIGTALSDLSALAAALLLALAAAPACAQGAALGQARTLTTMATPRPNAQAPVPSPVPSPVHSVALIALDRTALRAAPREAAAVQAELTQGDLLEVRGARLDHLQVYDHRRERAGFVRAESVRRISLQAAEADELLAVLRFLRHAPGQEALGIAYVAAYLQAAPAERIGAEPFDALGTMAERLARRASNARAGDAASSQVEAVAAHGVRFVTLERDGRLQLCYDGEAFRRVLALEPDAATQARAMLALTRHDCIDPLLTPTARAAFDAWRADLLDLPWPRGYNELSALMKNRLHLRRAGVWAARAHQAARLNRPAQQAAERALAELAAVDKSEFADEDQLEYAEAAIRVGAVRWAAVPHAAPAPSGANGLRLVTRAGNEAGQTCVQLFAAEASGRAPAKDDAASGPGPRLLAERCTFGTVWASSATARPGGDALALAVQPLEGWTELWLFRPERTEGPEGADRAARTPWRIDVLPPAAAVPGLGYVEFAGWVPGTQPRLLIARESRTDGRFNRRFEVLALDTLDAVKQASTPQLLVAFGQWSDAQWRRRTVAVR